MNYKVNLGVDDRNLGEYGYNIGIEFPAGTSLAGKTVSCIIEDPDGNAVAVSASISGVMVYHTVASGEIDAVGYWWYWIKVGTDEIYGPVGVHIHPVPVVS